MRFGYGADAPWVMAEDGVHFVAGPAALVVRALGRIRNFDQLP